MVTAKKIFLWIMRTLHWSLCLFSVTPPAMGTVLLHERLPMSEHIRPFILGACIICFFAMVASSMFGLAALVTRKPSTLLIHMHVLLILMLGYLLILGKDLTGLKDNLGKQIFFSIKEYENNGVVQFYWDRIQQSHRCCGFFGLHDWKRRSNEEGVPWSCCKHANCSLENWKVDFENLERSVEQGLGKVKNPNGIEDDPKQHATMGDISPWFNKGCKDKIEEYLQNLGGGISIGVIMTLATLIVISCVVFKMDILI